MERVFITNLKEYGNPILLRTWKGKGPCRSRLDNYQNFSVPFKGRNKHTELGTIRVLTEITNLPIAKQLLNW